MILLHLCTTNTKLNFLNKSYHQIDTEDIGSPLGTILAEIFMAQLEEKSVQVVNDIVLYRRGVSDIRDVL